jgi:hypothetical protein
MRAAKEAARAAARFWWGWPVRAHRPHLKRAAQASAAILALLLNYQLIKIIYNILLSLLILFINIKKNYN